MFLFALSLFLFNKDACGFLAFNPEAICACLAEEPLFFCYKPEGLAKKSWAALPAGQPLRQSAAMEFLQRQAARSIQKFHCKCSSFCICPAISCQRSFSASKILQGYGCIILCISDSLRMRWQNH